MICIELQLTGRLNIKCFGQLDIISDYTIFFLLEPVVQAFHLFNCLFCCCVPNFKHLQKPQKGSLTQAFLPKVQNERNRSDEEMVKLQSKVGDLCI